MAKTHAAVHIKHPNAEYLADLYGIENDLTISEECCHKVDKIGDPYSPHNSFLIEALITTAIIKYIRCFPSNSRAGLSRKFIEKLNDSNLIELHDYYKALRDKYISHAVNPLDDSYATASIEIIDKDKKEYSEIKSFNSGHTRILLSNDMAKDFLNLVQAIHELVKKLIVDEEKRLLIELSKLPQEQIHNGDLYTPRPFKYEDVFKSKKRKSKNKKLI